MPRANGSFAWEWRYIDPATGGYKSKTLPGNKYPEKADAEKHLRPFIARLTSGETEDMIIDPTVGDVIDCFIAEEGLIEIKKRKPGAGRAAGRTSLLDGHILPESMQAVF